MVVTYFDPDQRGLFVAALPDGGFGVWWQKAKNAPRRLISKGYINPEGYPTFDEAQKALDLYISNRRYESSSYSRWDVLVNGVRVEWEEYQAMRLGNMAVPAEPVPDAIVTLANIEYRINMHMNGIYENFLEVGRCLNEAKDAGLVPHGQWEAWVLRNTGLSERKAQRLMQAAREARPGSALSKLSISKIQTLLVLPEADREPMAEKALEENLTVKQLKEQIERERRRGDQLIRKYNEANEKARDSSAALQAKEQEFARRWDEREALYAENTERQKNLLQKSHEDEMNGLRAQIEEMARQAVNPEAQAEIERLQRELADMEAYAEQQAELRQEAQQAMLNAQISGQPAQESQRFGVDQLAAAVRAFLGEVGVMAHMGAELGQLSAQAKSDMHYQLQMVSRWVADATQALNTVIMESD